ncbi:MAG: RNA binding protein Nrd1, partial [Paramarteilia canceri]
MLEATADMNQNDLSKLSKVFTLWQHKRMLDFDLCNHAINYLKKRDTPSFQTLLDKCEKYLENVNLNAIYIESVLNVGSKSSEISKEENKTSNFECIDVKPCEKFKEIMSLLSEYEKLKNRNDLAKMRQILDESLKVFLLFEENAAAFLSKENNIPLYASDLKYFNEMFDNQPQLARNINDENIFNNTNEIEEGEIDVNSVEIPNEPSAQEDNQTETHSLVSKYLAFFIRKDCVSVLSKTVWIGRLSKSLQERDLRYEIKKYGTIAHLSMISARGCAFVRMTKRSEAFKLKRKLVLNAAPEYFRDIRISWALAAECKDSLNRYWIENDGICYIPVANFTYNLYRMIQSQNFMLIIHKTLPFNILNSVDSWEGLDRQLMEDMKTSGEVNKKNNANIGSESQNSEKNSYGTSKKRRRVSPATDKWNHKNPKWAKNEQSPSKSFLSADNSEYRSKVSSASKTRSSHSSKTKQKNRESSSESLSIKKHSQSSTAKTDLYTDSNAFLGQDRLNVK